MVKSTASQPVPAWHRDVIGDLTLRAAGPCHSSRRPKISSTGRARRAQLRHLRGVLPHPELSEQRSSRVHVVTGWQPAGEAGRPPTSGPPPAARGAEECYLGWRASAGTGSSVSSQGKTRNQGSVPGGAPRRWKDHEGRLRGGTTKQVKRSEVWARILRGSAGQRRRLRSPRRSQTMASGPGRPGIVLRTRATLVSLAQPVADAGVSSESTWRR